MALQEKVSGVHPEGNMNVWTNHPTLVEIFQSGPTETIVPTPLPSLKTRSRATFQNSSTWDIILTKTTTELHDFPALFSRTQAPGGTSDHKLPPCVRKQEKQAWTRLCLHAHPVPAQRSSFIQDELWGEVSPDEACLKIRNPQKQQQNLTSYRDQKQINPL